MMTMMTRWQWQQQPDWSTNTTIDLVQYDIDGDGKGNGGAGVMGRMVGQATCMVSAWRPGGTDLKSVIAEMNKLAMNKLVMNEKKRQTNDLRWMNEKKNDEQTNNKRWQSWRDDNNNHDNVDDNYDQ